MKQGRTINELATELVRQQKNKRDYVVDTSILSMTPQGTLRAKSDAGMPVTQYAHGQISQRLGIPQQYYMRCLSDAPELLAMNVNRWLTTMPERRMIRTMDGHIRAFLSDRYKPLDNFDLAEAVLPQIKQTACEIVSCEVTETRLYIKAVTKRITGEISKGDIVQAGLVVSNSEVGAGALSIEPPVYRLVCSNGMIANDHAIKRHHVGSRLIADDANAHYYSAQTRQLDDRAFWAKVRDTVDGVLSEKGFQQLVQGMISTKQFKLDTVKSDPQQPVEDVTEKLALTAGEKTGVLSHLAAGGDLSGYGLLNAITRTPQDVEDYDRATEVERIGGLLLNWTVADWQSVGMVR